MMIHLLDEAKHPLLPQAGTERMRAMQWLLFFNSTMQQAYGAYFLLSRNLKDREAAAPALDLVSRRIQKLWRYVESQMTGPFMCGDQPCAADILMAVIANWSGLITPAFILPDKVAAACRRVSELPYMAQALTIEGVTYAIS